MTRRQKVIEQARKILGSYESAVEAVGAAVGGEFEGGYESVERMTPPGRDLGEMRPTARAMAEEAVEDIQVGLDAMKKVELGQDADISTEDEQGLEAIILLAGRPAILIQEGDFMEPPSLWTSLKDKRQQIKQSVWVQIIYHFMICRLVSLHIICDPTSHVS